MTDLFPLNSAHFQCGGIAVYHLLQVMSPKLETPSAPAALAPGAAPMDVTLHPHFSAPNLHASRGTDLGMPGASSSDNASSLSESVEEVLTPRKAQTRQEINQLRHDMQ